MYILHFQIYLICVSFIVLEAFDEFFKFIQCGVQHFFLRVSLLAVAPVPLLTHALFKRSHGSERLNPFDVDVRRLVRHLGIGRQDGRTVFVIHHILQRIGTHDGTYQHLGDFNGRTVQKPHARQAQILRTVLDGCEIERQCDIRTLIGIRQGDALHQHRRVRLLRLLVTVMQDSPCGVLFVHIFKHHRITAEFILCPRAVGLEHIKTYGLQSPKSATTVVRHL